MGNLTKLAILDGLESLNPAWLAATFPEMFKKRM